MGNHPPLSLMSDQAPETGTAVRAVLKIRLDQHLDKRAFELQTCDRHERAERVRQALRWQLALMAFEKRHVAITEVPEAAGFINEDSVFIGTC